MSLFLTLLIVTMLTLAGCSTGALSGPDLDMSDETTLQEAPPSYSPNAIHNEEEDAGKHGDKVKKPPKGATNSTSGNGGPSSTQRNVHRNPG